MKVLVDITAVYYTASSASEQEENYLKWWNTLLKKSMGRWYNYMYARRTIAYLAVFWPQVTSEKFDGFVYELLQGVKAVK